MNADLCPSGISTQVPARAGTMGYSALVFKGVPGVVQYRLRAKGQRACVRTSGLCRTTWGRNKASLLQVTSWLS